MKMPSTTCQRFTIAAAKDAFQWTVCLGPRARPGRVHTGILVDDDRTLEIYHLGKQATAKVGKRGELRL